MFSFSKKKADQLQNKEIPDAIPKKNLFQRLKKSLSKTRIQLKDHLFKTLLGKEALSSEILKELEHQLIHADLGPHVTQNLIRTISQKLSTHELQNGESLLHALRNELVQILTKHSTKNTNLEAKPHVILIVGSNGTGKTTTIGKLAHYYQSQGKKVLLAAGDTFRAAAIEQLKVWADRTQAPLIAQHTGADSASVLFDAFTAAKSRNVDILIADTAGRLHNKNNLMEELKKIKRVLSKIDSSAPHEILLVLDAGIGQNAIAQAEQFHSDIHLTGLIITKLDGTAKGGVVFAICQKLGLPIKFLGLGEHMEDLDVFDPQTYVDALFEIQP